MRLIDADGLREYWLENGENEYVYDTNAFLDSIDNQPTIDTVVHGQESNPLNEWISVKDKLPLCGERVIMTDGVFVCEGFLNISGKWMRNGIGWIESEITHWMPMPKPPEMKKTEK